MRSPKARLFWSLLGGLACHGIFKFYLYKTDRAQYEDSNLLISVVFILAAAVGIYLFLSFVSTLFASKK